MTVQQHQTAQSLSQENWDGTPSKQMNRRDVLASGMALGATVLTGCSELVGGDTSDTVSYRHRFDRSGIGSAIYDAGIELGVWEDEKLDVEFLTSSGSQAAAQSVASGDDAFANAEIAAVLQLIEEGAPLVIIAQETTPMDGVIARGEVGVSSWADLEGAVVSRFPMGVTPALASAALSEEVGDPDAVEWRNVDPGAHMPLLMEGKIDAAVAYYPQAVARLEYHGFDPIILPHSDILNHLGNTLITHREFLEEEPEIVDRFVRGWLTAHETFITEPEAVISVHEDIVVEFDEEVERQVLPWIFAARINPEVELDHGRGWTATTKMRNTLDVLEQAEMIGSAADPETYFTNEVIENNRDQAISVASTYHDVLSNEYDVTPEDV